MEHFDFNLGRGINSCCLFKKNCCSKLFGVRALEEELKMDSKKLAFAVMEGTIFGLFNQTKWIEHREIEGTSDKNSIKNSKS